MSGPMGRIPWKPLQGLPDGARKWGGTEYRRCVRQWKKLRRELEDRDYDRAALDAWLRRRRRAFAIETGQIEGLYLLRRGVTEELLYIGLQSAHPSDDLLAGLDGDALRGLLVDQELAIDMVFDCVARRRPLSNSVIQEWHQLLVRHQDFANGIRQDGRPTLVPLRKGAYKIRPNNPMRLDGFIHEYCPPEQTRSEMDRLLAMHGSHADAGLPASVEAAWLHHRFVSTHPFQDGNGRVSRLLAAYIFVRNGEVPPVITLADRNEYFDVLELADQGDLQPFADFLERRAMDILVPAIREAQRALEEVGRAGRARMGLPRWGDTAGDSPRALSLAERMRRRLTLDPGAEAIVSVYKGKFRIYLFNSDTMDRHEMYWSEQLDEIIELMLDAGALTKAQAPGFARALEKDWQRATVHGDQVSSEGQVLLPANP